MEKMIFVSTSKRKHKEFPPKTRKKGRGKEKRKAFMEITE